MRESEQSRPSVVTTVAMTLGVVSLLIAAGSVGIALNDGGSGSKKVGSPQPGVTASTSPAPTVDHRIDFAAKPEDAFVARDPLAPASSGATGTVHEISLTAEEVEIEIAPGVKQMMWTFGGQVPGPVIRGKIGDTFRITLTNAGELGHSVDFHASKVAWDDEMRTIAQGETLVYEFEAKHAGAFMYHCGTAPALHHIGMGMYGAIIIDPPDLEPVDREVVFVQSELYEAPVGEAASYDAMVANQWDAVVFNGYVNQYRDRPIEAKVGERIRAWVLDHGPSENSSFHVVGTIFDTVYKEGAWLLRRDDGSGGGSQALDLQASQGGFVEFSFDEPGLYPMVTHKFSNVVKGALGLYSVK